MELIKALIRHGEKTVCFIESEEGEEVAITVTEYIASDLKQDDIQFHNPLHKRLLKEAEIHLHDVGFCAERYFLTHTDATISRLAAEMINDKYQLSKSNEEALTKDEERLHELIPQLLITFKLAIVEEEMKQTIQQLGKPEVAGNMERSMEIMKHYKVLTETLKELAKIAGYRVVIKA